MASEYPGLYPKTKKFWVTGILNLSHPISLAEDFEKSCCKVLKGNQKIYRTMKMARSILNYGIIKIIRLSKPSKQIEK